MNAILSNYAAVAEKNLKWNLTVRPAEVSLVENLKDEEYLRLFYNGSLNELPAHFANLENCSPPGLMEQWGAYSGYLMRYMALATESECVRKFY